MSSSKNHNSGMVVWITGLSGSGKTTLANETAFFLRAAGHGVVVLDGDELREVFGDRATNQLSYSRNQRLALAMQYAHLCRIFAAQGLIIVVATISLFREVHAWNRANLPNYFEVYLKVPLDELRRRDPKGIYRRFDAGEIKDVAGLDLPIDEPYSADWVVEFMKEQTASLLAEELITKLNGHLNEN